MIKALIFDLDNTLIDRKRAFVEMLKRVFSQYYDDNKVLELIDDMLVYDKNGSVPRNIAFKQLADKHHITEIDPDQFASDWSKESGSVAYLYDDVRDTLTQLKKKYTIAILSNGHYTSQRRKLKTIQIDDLIDYSLISSEYICDKPDKRIYQYTCQQLGYQPDECVYIGDSYFIDIEGSKNAGLNAVFVNRTNEHHPDTVTIKNISELLQIF